MIKVSRENWDLFKNCLLEKTNSVFETGIILRKVKETAGNREKIILQTISHIEKEGDMLRIYNEEGCSFYVDYRRSTKLMGRICG